MSIKLNHYEQLMILSDIGDLRSDIQDLVDIETDKTKKEKLNSMLSTLKSIEEAVGF